MKNSRLGNLDLGLEREKRIRKLLSLSQRTLDDLPITRIAQKVRGTSIEALVGLDGRRVRVAVLGLGVWCRRCGRGPGGLVRVDGDHLFVAIGLLGNGAHFWLVLLLVGTRREGKSKGCRLVRVIGF